MNKYLADISTFPGDVRHAWRSDGATGLWTEIAERTVYRIARSAHYDLYERDLASINKVPMPEGVLVRKLEPSEYDLLSATLTSRRRAQLEHDAASRTIFVALRGDVVVGYSWWTPYFDSALDFSPLALPVDATFHGFVHVERSERRRGTASALFSIGEQYLHEQGARVCWFLIKSSNIAGARAARGRVGGRSVHVAEMSYRKTPLGTKRTLTLAPSK